MPDAAEYLDLSAGDSEIILTNTLKNSLLDFYCDRSVIEKMWPPTIEEKKDTPNANYSQTKIYQLLKEEGITDRKVTRHPSGNVLFKKSDE